MTSRFPVTGVGVGLRRPHLDAMAEVAPGTFDFLEIAPENWVSVGGSKGKRLRRLTDRYPFVCHGLSLSLGGPSPLDETFLIRIRRFLDEHRVRLYSDHLSYATDDAHLFDLLPMPFTEEAVHHVAARVKRTQDILGRRIAIENVSYYTTVATELSEIDFVNAILAEADCLLLLDVNNIYVNSFNHRFDPVAFLTALPPERVAYFHVAGHLDDAEDLKVDTHGAPLIEPVYELLEVAYRHCGPVPTLLERDLNIPPIEELAAECARIRAIQSRFVADEPRRAASSGS